MLIKSTIKFGFVLMITFSSFVQINAQTGISFTAGVAGAKNQLESISPKSSLNLGFAGALEARFLGEGMYFVVQLEYAKYKLLAEEKYEFAEPDNNFQVGHGRIGMGFTLFRFGYNNIIRAKILGSLDKTLEYTSGVLKDTEYNKLNDATVGVLAGLGFDFKWFVVDIEYQKGLINAFYEVDGSNFDYVSLRTGILIH